MERTSTVDDGKAVKDVKGVQGGPPALDQRIAARYPDLLKRFDPDLIDRHQGLLRFAVERPDVAPGHYAVAPASAIGWTRLEVRAFDDDRLAGFRVVYRRGRAGVYEVVPRRQIRPALERIAAAAELARARFRALCGRCDGRLSSDEARERGTCDGCWTAREHRRVAQQQAKVRRAEQRRHVLDSYRRRVLAVLAQHPAEGLWRSEVAAALGVEPGMPGGYRLDLALQELTEAAEIVAELGVGPTSKGLCKQRRFRLARPLGVVDGAGS